MSEWVQEIQVIMNKALTDWYDVNASFCISEQGKQEMRVSHYGGGAFSWMVRGH